jgi:hypothetical protein
MFLMAFSLSISKMNARDGWRDIQGKDRNLIVKELRRDLGIQNH